MEIILKEDVRGLGYKNDIVKVKDGYGRNYLLPQKLAILASESSRKVLAENLKQAAHKVARIKSDAENLAAKIGALKVEIATKVGDTGRIFGAITSLQVSDALKAKGFAIDRKKISFTQEIKAVGTYNVVLDLHKEVKHAIEISIIAE